MGQNWSSEQLHNLAMLAYIMLIARTISTFDDTHKGLECFVEAQSFNILDNADLHVHSYSRMICCGIGRG